MASFSTTPVLSSFRKLIPFSLFYLGIGVLVIVARWGEGASPWFEYLSKPLIMLSLLGYFLYELGWPRQAQGRWTLLAMGFSLLGDICLMFVGETWFLAGLVAFLLGHLSYILAFQTDQWEKTQAKLLRRKGWLLLPWLAYGALLLSLVLPHSPGFQGPIILYAGVILTMAMAALNRWNRVSMQSFAYVLLGAQLFLLSDSLIAIDRFVQDAFPIRWASTWIMLTYLAAQYLIVIGLLFQQVEQAERGELVVKKRPSTTL
jgi:uncharacterized membrane protein YhhN